MKKTAPNRWLLLRGLGRAAAHWEDFPTRMEKATGTSIHLIDLPGIGEEQLAAPPRRVRDYADFVRNRWQEIAKDGTWGIVGVSFGGMIALDWLNRHPSDFVSGVISSTSSMDSGKPWERLQPRATVLLSQAFRAKSVLEREKHIVRMVSNRNDAEQIVEKWTEISNRSTIPSKSVTNQLMAAISFRAPAKISADLLFLTSWGDRMVSPYPTVRMAKKFNSPLVIHPSAGHDIALDDPDWYLGQIINNFYG